MPIYNYTCKKCSSTKDEIRNVEKRDETSPCIMGCGGKMERTIAVPAPAQFKGKGWTPKRLERR